MLGLGDREVDLGRLTVRGEGVEHRLTPTEARALAYLWSQRGRTVSREELLREVWGYSEGVVSRTLDATLSRLRAKVEEQPSAPRHLRTVRGVGYRFEGPAAPTVPPRRSRFFGRVEELESLAFLASAGPHLLTLVGPGGVGKTRLATELAAGLGHAWCDLQHLDGGVAGALAAALRLPAGASLDRTLLEIAALLGRPGAPLLIVDNAEHLLDEVAVCVGPLLQRGGRVLVTSRAPLRIEGERLLRLGPLPPDAAVELLVDRARALRPAFGRGPQDGEHLHACVELIDRLPLAIELAAARADLRSAESLRRGLQEPVAFLDDGLESRDLPARHLSLEALLDWSWSRMEGPAQEALLRCSLFAAPFDAEAGDALVGAAPLRLLLERSLLVHAPPAAPDLPLRLRMLEIVRSYCAPRLLGDPLAQARDAHRRWFCERAQELQERCREGSMPARAELSAISGDVLRAADFALEQGDREAVVEALLTLRFLVRQGSIPLRPRDYVQRLRAPLDDSVPPELRARALICIGGELCRMGEHDAVDAALDRAQALAESLGSPRLEGRVLNIRVRSLSSRSRFDDAIAAALRGIDCASRAGDLRIQAHLTLDLANVLKRGGDHAASAEGLHQARALYERAKDRGGLSAVLVNLAGLAVAADRMTEARSLFFDARRIQQEEGHEVRAACTALYLAFLHLLDEDCAAARELLEDAVPTVQLRAAPAMRAFAGRLQAMEAILGGRLDETADRLTEAVSTCTMEYLRRADRGLLGQVRALQRRRWEVDQLLAEQLAGEQGAEQAVETRVFALHAELLSRLDEAKSDARPGALPPEVATWLSDLLPTLPTGSSTEFAIRLLRAELDPELVALS